MTIKLMYNSSENNAIGKTLTEIRTVSAICKNPISLENPVLILEFENDIKNINYAYIDDFKRYYFIKDIEPLTGNRYSISLHVDVLESFKTNIKSLSCIIDKQSNLGQSNKYLNDGSYVVQNNEFNSIVNFSQGFNENGTFILICAGG